MGRPVQTTPPSPSDPRLQLLQELTVSPEAILREYVDEESASELRDYLEHLNFGDETAIRSHSIVKKISAEAETVVSVLNSMREADLRVSFCFP